MSARTVLRAPAKLTWSLRVTGVRDDGYHLIDAEMVTLDVADEVVVDESAAFVLTLGGPFATGVATDESNTVAAAMRATGRDAAVHVVKQIPSCGGLGGGSADAAAILRWAGISDAEVAVRIGADVPFCVVGGRARVTGIGELVEPLPFIARDVTLVIPPLRSRTPDVYSAWDDLGGPRGDGDDDRCNDLEPAAIVVEPRLAEWRDRIDALVGVRPRLAGSGATWFVEGDHASALAPLGDVGATVIATLTTA